MLAKLTAQEGKRDALVEAITNAIPLADGEPGTITYICHTDDNDANSVWFYELYEDADALKAHGGGEVIKAMGAALGGLIGAPPQLIPVTPFAGKGL